MTTTTRQQIIRRELRGQYAAAACNEVRVATLRIEMTSLPHQHSWIDSLGSAASRECRYCLAGTDQYFMTNDDILTAARSSY
jgi:hypothetical protein